MAQNRYITVAELAEAYDTRTLGQLSSDTGVAVTVNESNANLLAAIRRASAMVEAAALKGGRYTEDDLTARAADDDHILKNLVCRLTIVEVWRRRLGATLPVHVQEIRDETEKLLAEIGSGKTVFRDDEAITAGAVQITQIAQTRRNNFRFASDNPSFRARRDRLY